MTAPRMPHFFSFALMPVIALLVTACSSIDWRATAANSAASACQGSGSCKLSCPPNARSSDPAVCNTPAAMKPARPGG